VVLVDSPGVSLSVSWRLISKRHCVAAPRALVADNDKTTAMASA
jgi:hypothetical protein